jgi:hypothetical protein
MKYKNIASYFYVSGNCVRHNICQDAASIVCVIKIHAMILKLNLVIVMLIAINPCLTEHGFSTCYQP